MSRVGVVGAGVMGRGIAQVFAQAGHQVVIADLKRAAARDGLAFCTRMIRRKCEKGAISETDADSAIASLTDLDLAEVGYQGLEGCDLVIEAVFEDLKVKHEVIRALEQAVPNAVIATNTSSLSVTAIASAADRPGRIVGCHFFNPVPLMPLIELVPGLLTSDETIATVRDLLETLGHEVVTASDSPGFIVNHAGRALLTEALKIVSEGICSPATVDAILKGSAGFRMGPFEFMDLTGLDISHAVMVSLHEQYFGEPRFRPAMWTANRVTAGLLGRKTGRGFYRYPDTQDGTPKAEAVPVPAPTRPFWIDARAETGVRLKEQLSGVAQIESGGKASPDAVILATPLGSDCTSAALTGGLPPARTVAVDCLIVEANCLTLMPNLSTDADVLRAAHDALSQLGPVYVIRDSPGFVTQRVLAAIVNLGCEMAEQRVGQPDEIDRAVQLGLNYPMGPLAWGDKLGAPRILEIQAALHDRFGDPRYRASLWLQRRAELGLSLLSPDEIELELSEYTK